VSTERFRVFKDTTLGAEYQEASLIRTGEDAKRHAWKDEQPLGVFSYVDSEQRVPHDHPLRQLRAMVDEASRHWQHGFSELWPRSVVHR